MSVKTDVALKEYFDTGDEPTEAQFEDLIDSKKSILSSDKVADYTITDVDGLSVVRVTTAGVDRTVVLPTAADNDEREITIMKIDSGSGKITIDGEGAETIDFDGVQQTTIDCEKQHSGLRLKCNGTSWDVIGEIGGKLASIAGTLEMIYTKYMQGSLDADSQTDVAHGIADYTKIVCCTAYVENAGSAWFALGGVHNVEATANAFNSSYDATNVLFKQVGTVYQGDTYRIKIEYYV